MTNETQQLLLVLGTWAGVGVTWLMVRKQLSQQQRETRVRLLLLYEDRFEASRMINARRTLASDIRAGVPYERLEFTVLNFFESLGATLKRGFIDPEMAWVMFAYYAPKWWLACRDHIRETRTRHHTTTLFEEFESLVEELCRVEMRRSGQSRQAVEPTPADVQRFLIEENDLPVRQP